MGKALSGKLTCTRTGLVSILYYNDLFFQILNSYGIRCTMIEVPDTDHFNVIENLQFEDYILTKVCIYCKKSEYWDTQAQANSPIKCHWGLAFYKLGALFRALKVVNQPLPKCL